MAFFLYIDKSIIAVAWAQVIAGVLLGGGWHYLVSTIGKIEYLNLLKQLGGLLVYFIPLMIVHLIFDYWIKERSLIALILEVLVSAIVYLVFVYFFFRELITLGKDFFGFKHKNESTPPS